MLSDINNRIKRLYFGVKLQNLISPYRTFTAKGITGANTVTVTHIRVEGIDDDFVEFFEAFPDSW